MAGRRTIWTAALALGVLGLLTRCQKESRSPRPSASGQAGLPKPSAAPAPNPIAALASATIAETLSSVREFKLDIVAPRTPAQRLDFGLGRLAQASGAEVVFRETGQGEVVTRASIGAVRAVAHGSDGSLFALGASEGVRLEARALRSSRFPHTPLFPFATLFPALEDPTHFDVYLPEEQQLLRYPFSAEPGPILASDAAFRLEGCAEAVGLLKDGAYVCRTARGFARKAPRGQRSEYVPTSALPESLRLLPSQRLDQFFSVAPDGLVVEFRLAPGLPEVGRFRLPAVPYAAVGNGQVLAFVIVSEPAPPEPRRWTLLVTDLHGQPRLRADLPGKPAGTGDDWLAALVEAKNLAISWFEPLVAVGGASQLSVWDYEQGRLRFAR